MTSDAKIGLLLGLVFIFIIAFVINGLAPFHNAMDSNEPAAGEGFVQGDPIGYRERNAGVTEDTTAENSVPNEDDGPEYALQMPWSDENSHAQGNRVDETLPAQISIEQEGFHDYPPANDNTTSQNYAVSQDIERLRLNLPTTVTNNDEITQLARNTQEQSRIPAVNTSYGRGVPGQGGAGQGVFEQFIRQDQQVSLARTGNSNPQIPINPPVQAAQSNQATQQKTYVVQKGDNNLSNIAKKFYGEKEGNRWVNVNKIFEANKKEMKSPDKVFVGQTLIIPPPVPPVPEPAQPAAVLQGSMFQTVPSVGGGAARPNTARIQDTGKWYLVKEDDSLWKIAAEQLGKGTRFEEIKKLNADILTNENKLKTGMKLRMPDQ